MADTKPAEEHVDVIILGVVAGEPRTIRMATIVRQNKRLVLHYCFTTFWRILDDLTKLPIKGWRRGDSDINPNSKPQRFLELMYHT